MGWAAFAGDMLNKRFQTISLNYSFNSVKLVCKDIHCAIAAECPCHIYSTYSTLHPFFFFFSQRLALLLTLIVLIGNSFSQGFAIANAHFQVQLFCMSAHLL